MKKMFNIFNPQKKIKTTLSFHLIPFRMTRPRKQTLNVWLERGRDTGWGGHSLYSLLVGMCNGAIVVEVNVEIQSLIKKINSAAT